MSSKDQERQVSVDASEDGEPKQVLISYVRAEAAEHALSLKEALLSLNLSVYLVSYFFTPPMLFHERPIKTCV